MEQKRKAPTDAEMNANWDALLKEFHGICENSPKDFTKFEALKEKAKLTPLTGRQLEGIIDRCNNVIKNQYGNTKKGIEFKAS
jgi:hypothetical protein